MGSSELWLVTTVSEGCLFLPQKTSASRGTQSVSHMASCPQGKTEYPGAIPVQKMKALLAAEQALRGRFDLEVSVSNTSPSCLTSGLAAPGLRWCPCNANSRTARI